MKLNELRPARGAKKKRKRVGCGTGSGRGGTSGRGHKGQQARSGGSVPAWFEGGQMPIYRRLPGRGFFNPWRRTYQIVNVADLARFDAGAKIGVAELRGARLIPRTDQPVKLLGRGELAQAVTVEVHAASQSAVAKIGQSGGQVVILGTPAAPAAPPQPRRRQKSGGEATPAESSDA